MRSADTLWQAMSGNRLFYGDNLEVLQRHIADESVDLVYLDPPFNSNQDYNVLFAERDGTRAAAQIKAFKDTWRWDEARGALTRGRSSPAALSPTRCKPSGCASARATCSPTCQ